MIAARHAREPVMPAARAPGLRIEGVSLAFSGRSVLDRLWLAIAAGRWHALLGRSGTGKSSLLRVLAGLQSLDGGRVEVDDGQPLQGRIALMAQEDGLLPWLSARDNVMLGARLRGQPRAASIERARSLLEQVGLAERSGALPATLSGGQRQRVALARTLFEDRPVVLMDEPFSRLDAITRHALQALAHRLLGQRTVVLVTHDPLEALRLADAVSVLDEGAVRHTLGVEGHAPRDIRSAALLAQVDTLWSALQGA